VKKIYFIVLFVMALCGTARADTHNAASCSYAHVEAAVSASADGDTVIIPGGTCDWTTSQLSISKIITLQGAGSGAGGTIISGVNNIIIFSASKNGWRVTGIRLNISDGGTGIYVSEGGTGWRIDHCYFNSTNLSDGILARGNATTHAYGLIDSNMFVNARVDSYGDANCNQYADISTALPLGGADTIFVENNTFSKSVFGNMIDSNCAGRWVFRYNSVTETTADGYILESHSVQGDMRGSIAWEIYNNSFVLNPSNNNMATIGFIRGGVGIIHGNSATYAYTFSWGGSAWVFDNVRSNNSCSSVGSWGCCDGNKEADGNQDGLQGYPCRDQIGWAKDDWVWTVENPYPSQTLNPVYVFNNKNNGTTELVSVQGGTNLSSTHIDENRDFYNYNASCVGGGGCTAGVGTGTSMPTSCTTDTGFYRTDENKLYRCTGPSTWTSYYAPYTCPHPLTGLTGKSCNALVAGTSGYGIDAVQVSGAVISGAVIK
jgi:hypothetical protein